MSRPISGGFLVDLEDELYLNGDVEWKGTHADGSTCVLTNLFPKDLNKQV